MDTKTSVSIFSPFTMAGLHLTNRIVLAPMTRSRAIGNIPNELMATYYAQRATAGLIISEGVSPSPNGLGYSRIPGIFNQDHIEGWKKVTQAVHEKGGKIFVQLMHTGRVGHQLNLPEGAEVLAPSAVAAKGEMWTDTQNMQVQPVPRAMTLDEVRTAIREFVDAARNAIEAGFDGVELHGANGYLIEQFINPGTNTRNDEYGGSIENRSRFALEVAQGVADAIGKEKVGIRFSPFNGFNDMPAYEQVTETYDYLSKELDKIGILYIHTVNFGGLN
ncbi:MAG TPA: alkene reductase, partial [Cytophagaceae bacterium]